MPTTTLLHLSDLHFGYDADSVAKAQRAEALSGLLRTVNALPGEWRPGILAISGDLTWQGRPGGFDQLKAWLKANFYNKETLGLTPAKTVICPGNHDIDRKTAKGLEKRTSDPARADELLHPDALEDGFARPFAAYAAFAKSLKIPPPQLPKGAANPLVGVRTIDGIRFVCVNSAWFCRDSNTDRGALWLGLPQLNLMGLGDADDWHTAKMPFTVTLVHHPSEWLTDADNIAYNNRPGAFPYLAARSHVILSGHTHGPITRASQHEGAAYLFKAGASYDSAHYRNNFSILQIDAEARTIRRRAWEYDPRVQKWEEKQAQEYDLRAGQAGGAARTASTAKYFAWLRDQTRSIELNQLQIAPQEVPPPTIDRLFVKLKSAGGGREIVDADLAAAPRKSKGKKATPARMGMAEALPLEAAMEVHRRLVIEGKPGSGKTTFVRWVAWMLCRPEGVPEELRWLSGAFPVWVRISQLDEHIHKTLKNHEKGDPTTVADARWIAHFLASQSWDLDEAFFTSKFASEDAVLLLDGLDEAANEQRRLDMVSMIRHPASVLQCRIVVTTRPGVHQGRAMLEGFRVTGIDDLDDEGISGFLNQWCLWLKRGDATAAKEYFDTLRPAVAVANIRELAGNPLMLTSLAVLHFRRHRLPEQRVKLYEQILDWLAEQAADKHRQFSKSWLLERFGQLALHMQETGGRQMLSIGIGDAAQCLAAKGEALATMREFLEQAQGDSGIVTLRNAGEIAFWHRTFQEFLAARTMADLPDAELGPRARKMLYAAEAADVLPLVAGCLAENAKQRLTLLLHELVGDALGQKKLERKAHAVGVLGQMLRDVSVFQFELEGEDYRQLLREVMCIFERGKAQAIGLQTRIAAAEALDAANPEFRLSRPRDGRYWAVIPARTYPIGGDEKAFNNLPQKLVPLKRFQIGRYPVTVWEFEIYVNAAKVDPPEQWERQLKHPSHPIRWVTWRQADAYCKWAGCSLPSEQQWEAAARGLAGRIYPWEGDDTEEHRGNFGNRVKEPTPVGLFPDGETPDGVSDLIGNVWEWTSSDWGNDKCVRGAAFYKYEAEFLRAAARLRVEPGFSSFIGFRCVRE